MLAFGKLCLLSRCEFAEASIELWFERNTVVERLVKDRIQRMLLYFFGTQHALFGCRFKTGET